jgi:CheY-like chemotaxis protein
VFSNSSPAVFLVDDQPVVASTLAAILKLDGYSATCFTCALKALAAVRLQPPDLLISEVMMPNISGIDLAIHVRAECPGCKILLFSGQTGTQDLLEDARDRGYHFEFLQKPIHPSAIRSRIVTLAKEGHSLKLI